MTKDENNDSVKTLSKNGKTALWSVPSNGNGPGPGAEVGPGAGVVYSNNANSFMNTCTC